MKLPRKPLGRNAESRDSDFQDSGNRRNIPAAIRLSSEWLRGRFPRGDKSLSERSGSSDDFVAHWIDHVHGETAVPGEGNHVSGASPAIAALAVPNR